MLHYCAVFIFQSNIYFTFSLIYPVKKTIIFKEHDIAKTVLLNANQPMINQPGLSQQSPGDCEPVCTSFEVYIKLFSDCGVVACNTL